MESMVILSHTLGCVSYASQLSSITVAHSRAQRIHIRCKPNSWLVSFFGRHIVASKLGITMTPRSPLRGGGGGAQISHGQNFKTHHFLYWEGSHVPTGILLLYLFSTSSLLEFQPICCRLSSFQLFLSLFGGQITCQNFTQAGPLSRITCPSIVCQAL